jgi:hypothetical protein
MSEIGRRRNAKRLECVELAPAFRPPTIINSASKLDALQTLRAQERPRRLVILPQTYVPNY